MAKLLVAVEPRRISTCIERAKSVVPMVKSLMSMAFVNFISFLSLIPTLTLLQFPFFYVFVNINFYQGFQKFLFVTVASKF